MTAAFRPVQSGDHVLLVDGSGLIWRAYHAAPKIQRENDGHPIGALAGFCERLWSLLTDRRVGYFSHAAVVFDAGRRNWRHDLSAAYKAQRPAAPGDIVQQFGPIRASCEAFPICSVELAAYEADDLIATYARRAVGAGAAVTIATADKDMMQLVNDADRVRIFDQTKGAIFADEDVFAKFGVVPAHVADVLALMGDSSDNVAGVPSIGPTKAAALVNRIGTVEDILAAAAGGSRDKLVQQVAAHAEAAQLARRLVALDAAAPITLSLAHFAARPIDPTTLSAFLNEWGLPRLAERLTGEVAA